MKKLVTITFLVMLSIITWSQTYKLPINPGLDSLGLLGLSQKDGFVDPTKLTTISVQLDDSAWQFVLTRYKKVPVVLPPPTGGTPTYSNAYNIGSSLSSNQLGRGSVSTSVFHTGPGSFRSEVRAGDAPISSGWRSEQQYESTSQNPLEGIVDYWAFYENWSGFDGGGHSIQWHPYTSGASAIVSLQNYGGKFNVVRSINGTNSYQTNGIACQSNRWYHLRWEYKWSTGSDGYIRMYVDGVVNYSYKGKTADGSGQYLKVGQNRWPASGNSMKTTSVCYYDDLNIYKAGAVVPSTNLVPVARAGNDVALVLPANTTTLDGSGSTDDSAIISFNWNLVSGPSTYTLGTSNASTTSVTNLEAGTYTFKLTVTDNLGAVGTDNVSVVVTSIITPPPADTTGIALEGFGAPFIGGSQSSTVVHVTTFAQFVAGIGSNRTLSIDADIAGIGRFDLVNVSYMTIQPNGHSIDINNNNNGDGFSLDGSGTHHNIISGLTVHNAGNDCINILDGAHNNVITNCFTYDAADGNIDIAGGVNNTVQYCVLGRGKPGWGGDMLNTALNTSIHHNFFSPVTANAVGERCAFIHANYEPGVGNPNADFRGNLVWKWGRDNGTGSGQATAVCYKAQANVVDNYYYTTQSLDNAVTKDDGYGNGNTGVLYAKGNVLGSHTNDPNTVSNHAEFTSPPVYTGSACIAARRVLTKVGTFKKSSLEVSYINAAQALPKCPVQ